MIYFSMLCVHVNFNLLRHYKRVMKNYMLGINPNTLRGRISKLGIKHERRKG